MACIIWSANCILCLVNNCTYGVAVGGGSACAKSLEDFEGDWQVILTSDDKDLCPTPNQQEETKSNSALVTWNIIGLSFSFLICLVVVVAQLWKRRDVIVLGYQQIVRLLQVLRNRNRQRRWRPRERNPHPQEDQRRPVPANLNLQRRNLSPPPAAPRPLPSFSPPPVTPGPSAPTMSPSTASDPQTPDSPQEFETAPTSPALFNPTYIHAGELYTSRPKRIITVPIKLRDYVLNERK